MVYDNSIFDVAKLLDFAAIYGKSNPKQTQVLISTVLESEPRLVSDFKEAFEMMLNILKRIFKDALRSDQMIRGDDIQQKTRTEQDEIIFRLVKNLIEMLTNF